MSFTISSGLKLPGYSMARSAEMRKSVREKITYVAVIVALLGVVKLGHATHWTLTLPKLTGTSTSDNKSQVSSVTTPAVKVEASLPSDESIKISDSIALKAGIETSPAQRHMMTQMVIANGVVDYDQEQVAQLSVRVPGNVWRVEKQVGSIVKTGDVLAIIDAAEVGLAKSEFLQSMVSYEVKQKTVERMRHIGDALSERALREAEAGTREAKVRMLSMHQKLINLGLPCKVEHLAKLNDDERARHLQFLGLPESLTKTLDPDMTTANLLPMFAPFDGVVTGRAIALGEMVTPGEPHFVMADVRRMWVMLDVRKEDGRLVLPGQSMTFFADAAGTQITGKIDWISTELDSATRTLRVRAVVENPLIDAPGVTGEQRLLKARTFGTAQIVIRETNESLMVPTAAIQSLGRDQMVFVQQGERFAPRTVRVGAVDGGQVEILQGIAEGDQIAIAGSHVLKAQLQQQRAK